MSGTDFVLNLFPRKVKDRNTAQITTMNLLKIDKIWFNDYLHGFIIKNKDNTKQKRFENVPSEPNGKFIDMAYCADMDGADPIYQIFIYDPDVYKDNMILSQKFNKSIYLVLSQELQKLLDETKTEDVPKGGGARRKSKNVKKSRRKSRKSRKQRKSNKNRRTKYYKK
jgi:hypothetical protein